AVALYAGNPVVHNHGTLMLMLLLSKVLGTFNRYSATSVDQLPHMLASLTMFGHQLLMPVPDVDRCSYLLMLGANPLVSNGSIMTAPGIKNRLAALRRRGGRLVVIDPRRSETAKMADQHVFVRPGSDAMFLAALLHTLFAEGLVALGRLAAFTDGVEALRHAVASFSPAACAAATGIDAAVTVSLARELAAAERAAVYGRVGVCTQRFGGLNGWLINALNIVTGNLDREGGVMLTTPAADLVALAGRLGEQGHFDKGRSRVHELPEFGGEYPAATLADEITTAGDGRIRALITIAGNPVLSTPNGAKLERALPKLAFMASVDLYRNETTRHANLIFPATAQLEQGHYDLAFHALAVRNTAKYSPPLFQPPAGALHDWQILLQLATRIIKKRGGVLAGLGGSAAALALSRLGADGALDLMLRTGPYGAGAGFGPDAGLSLSSLRNKPHGIDLGPLLPRLPERLSHPNKRIALAPAIYLADLNRLAAERDRPSNAGELLLIGRRQLRNNNSWLHNSRRMVKGRDRCTLLMHPSDAKTRGVAHGEQVVVRSRVGEVRVPLHVSEQVMAGVVSLPHGFGHHRPGTQLSVARAAAGASANDVTDDQWRDELSGTAAINGVVVSVTAVDTADASRPHRHDERRS
ncbi:MAG TPA: molybdopterin oxidoreductase family protein, partial [Sorangium sp.]|nr:molybdopterin oxidoreductase family protein [Sorangium sp.]